MKYLLTLAAGFAVGYLIVDKGYPAVVARIEAMDLDSVWEIWDTEELM